jgi:hypothetical protein
LARSRFPCCGVIFSPSPTPAAARRRLPRSAPRCRYEEALRLADHAIYKKAMMAEILDHRMYKEADLKRLFSAYMRLAPPGDKETVAAVVRQLKKELLVK